MRCAMNFTPIQFYSKKTRKISSLDEEDDSFEDDIKGKKKKATNSKPMMRYEDYDFNGLESPIEKSLNHFQTKLDKLIVSKASPSILDEVKVKVQNETVDLNSVANIFAKDASTLIVKVYDEGLIKIVNKAIVDSKLGFTPIPNDSSSLIINFPKFNKEYKENLYKSAKSAMDDAKTSVSKERAKVFKNLAKLKDSMALTDYQRIEKELKIIYDKFTAEADALLKKKKAELSDN